MSSPSVGGIHPWSSASRLGALQRGRSYPHALAMRGASSHPVHTIPHEPIDQPLVTACGRKQFATERSNGEEHCWRHHLANSEGGEGRRTSGEPKRTCPSQRAVLYSTKIASADDRNAGKLLTVPDGHEVFIVWSPKSCLGLPTGTSPVSSHTAQHGSGCLTHRSLVNTSWLKLTTSCISAASQDKLIFRGPVSPAKSGWERTLGTS